MFHYLKELRKPTIGVVIFYLAVHHNAGINGGSGGGIVVYRYPQSSKKSQELQPKFYNALIKHTGLKG